MCSRLFNERTRENSPIKTSNCQRQTLIYIVTYISNSLDTGVIIKYLLLHRRANEAKLIIEPITAEAHRVRVLTCTPQLILRVYTSNNLFYFNLLYFKAN